MRELAARSACARRSPARCNSPWSSRSATLEPRLRPAARLSSSSLPRRGVPASTRRISSTRCAPRRSAERRAGLAAIAAAIASSRGRREELQRRSATLQPSVTAKPSTARRRPRAARGAGARRATRASAARAVGPSSREAREARARCRERDVVRDHELRERARSAPRSARVAVSSQSSSPRCEHVQVARRCGPARVSSSA